MSGCGGHHHHGCGDGHDHESPETGISYSLYTKIDLNNLQCLNESVENSGKTVFKPWEERLSLDKVGTTVSLQNIFYTLPVRHKEFLRNLKKEFFKMVQVLYSYCLISTNVRIVCTNQCEKGKKTTLVSTDVRSLMKDNISSLFGPKQVGSLLAIIQKRANPEVLTEFGISQKSNISDQEMFQLEGFISSCAHGQGRSSSDRQFYFINNRPCDPAKIIRLVNEVYHHYNKSQFPMVVLSIRMEQSDVDVNVTPDKRQILINQEKLLLATLKTTLICLYENIPSTFDIQNSTLNTFLASSPTMMSLGPSTPTFKNNNLSNIIDKYSRTPPLLTNSPKSSCRPTYGGIKRCISSVTDEVNRNKQPKLEDFSFKSSATNSPSSNSDCLTSSMSPLSELNADGNTNSKIEGNNEESMLLPSKEETSPPHPCIVDFISQSENNNEERDDEFAANIDGNNKSDDASTNSIFERINEISKESKLNGFVRNGGDVGREIPRENKSFGSKYQPSPSNSCTEAHARANDFLNSLKAKKLTFTPKEKIDKNKNVCQEYLTEDKSFDLPASLARESRPIESEVNVIEEYDKVNVLPLKVKSLTITFSLESIREKLKRQKNKHNSEMIRKFRAIISPSDNLSAEEELKKEISKSSFSKMKIIGQFNLGFIIAQLNSDLFMIDQHATDEKYNFETLQKSCVLENQKLIIPQRLELTAVNEGILIDNLDIFVKNGFEFKIEEAERSGRKVSLLSMPHSKGWEFGREDIEEMIFMLSDAPGVMCRPSRIQAMFASRSCRKSVMIGTHLSHNHMRRLVDHMGEIEQPWNCPHGRPTMRHLININVVSKLYETK